MTNILFVNNNQVNSNDAISTQRIDVINVYNVYQKILCKRVYYFVNVYLNKNHMSETKQNYDGKPSYSALRSIPSLI